MPRRLALRLTVQDVLIVGEDSLIGRALGGVLSAQGHRVIGTTRRQVQFDKASIILDLADPDCADVDLPSVDVVYFCAAITRMADCRSNEALARQVNVTAPTRLAQRMAADGARTVLISTNAVFDGTRPLIDASAETRPLSTYGRLKVEAEEGFLSLGNAASILRLSKVLDPQIGLLRGWATALGRGEPIRAFSDHHFAPVTLGHAVAALAAMADDTLSGIYQFSAARDISYLEAANFLACRICPNAALVDAQSARECGLDPSEITNFSSLDSTRLTALCGIVAPDPFEVIEKFVELGSS